MLFEKYKDGMYTVVYRILRSENLSCDALQDGFIDVFTNLSAFRAKSTLGAWMKTIMVRKALRIVEKEIHFEDYEEEFRNAAVDWDDELTGELLDRAIASLSPGYRSVFLLIEVEGYLHKEVAEMLGISIGTSKSQLSRAKKILQEKIKELNS